MLKSPGIINIEFDLSIKTSIRIIPRKQFEVCIIQIYNRFVNDSFHFKVTSVYT